MPPGNKTTDPRAREKNADPLGEGPISLLTGTDGLKGSLLLDF